MKQATRSARLTEIVATMREKMPKPEYGTWWGAVRCVRALGWASAWARGTAPGGIRCVGSGVWVMGLRMWVHGLWSMRAMRGRG
eukprot:365315-Chlamydomonas_euryale.AAC.18